MPKFSRNKTRPNVTAPVATTGALGDRRTFEGADAFGRDAKSELFLLAVTNMVSEDAFYEVAVQRDQRFTDLVRQVTAEEGDWMQRFIPWLRREALMRSASTVAAAEYVAARGVHGRQVVASTLIRADEPAEALAYWTMAHGRNVPQPMKRGIADAVGATYDEYSAMKYDGLSRAWRMGDVIELTHPKPRDEAQSHLFRFLLDRRHHPEDLTVPDTLPKVQLRRELEDLPDDQRRARLRAEGSELLARAGATWEWLSGWLPGGMDAEAWQAVIPTMGYMALLRNLRNFDEAEVSDAVADRVAQRLADPEQVAQSRQFPYRFWSAYRNVPSARWVSALERALDTSVSNVPALPGRTLVLTDTSASMTGPVSRQSKIRHFEIAALFAAAVAKRAEAVDLVSFASDWERLKFRPKQSVLRTIEMVENRIGRVGHGTELGKALRTSFDGHDRVVVFSDMQTHDQVPELPPTTTVYVFNTGGYGATPLRVGARGRYELGGFSDATFRLMAVLEQVQNADWPF